MSEQYKMQRIKEYLIFHIKDSKERIELLDYLDQLQQKENIIKEAKEFIYKCNDGKQGINYSGCSKLLEILEKENNGE